MSLSSDVQETFLHRENSITNGYEKCERMLATASIQTVPMRHVGPRALHELHRQSPDPTFVFTTERGAPFDAIDRLVKRIEARAGFTFPVHAHVLRHACGYALANAQGRALHQAASLGINLILGKS
jgi:integrase